MPRTETHSSAPDSKPNCHQNCHSKGVDWWMVRDNTISPMELTEEALRARVRIHPKTGCWEYTGACDANGYGRVFLSGKERKAPRVYFEVFVGPLPAGARLKHTLPSEKCIGGRCCNPAHVKVEQSFNEIKFARRICPKGHRSTPIMRSSNAEAIIFLFAAGHVGGWTGGRTSALRRSSDLVRKLSSAGDDR